jgi:hypothetical protein
VVKQRIIRISRIINLPGYICRATLGHQHKQSHRMVAGLCVMAVGVVVMKSAGHIHYELVSWTVEGLGGAIHGMGLTPYIEILLAEEA